MQACLEMKRPILIKKKIFLITFNYIHSENYLHMQEIHKRKPQEELINKNIMLLKIPLLKNILLSLLEIFFARINQFAFLFRSIFTFLKECIVFGQNLSFRYLNICRRF